MYVKPAFTGKPPWLKLTPPRRDISRFSRPLHFPPRCNLPGKLSRSVSKPVCSMEARQLWSGARYYVLSGVLLLRSPWLKWHPCTHIFGFSHLHLYWNLTRLAFSTPVVGAQYRWSALYAPRGFGSPAFWSLLQGWITVFAWMALCAQVCFLEGTVIQGLIALNNPDTYIP